MKVTKEKTDFGNSVTINDDDKSLNFVFGGNLDLYWNLVDRNGDIAENNKFIITKENYGIYALFETLFYDIENINLYDDDKDIPLYIESEEEKEEYLRRKEQEIEKDKFNYRERNYSNYNELFNKDTNTITWYSDETAHKVANILTIKKEEDKFIVEFKTQPYVPGYELDFNSDFDISIRFRNSGSSYDPFNFLFMKMYNNMENIDDVNDIGHQLHIEEYLYNNFRKKLERKPNKDSK